MKTKKRATNNLTSKLSAYSAVAIGAVAMANPANAQVQFNDIPDQELTLTGGQLYGFDLDLDGNNDIGFFGFEGAGTYAGTPYTYTLGYAYPFNYTGIQNEIVGTIETFGTTTLAAVAPLSSGTSIGVGSVFNDSARHTLSIALDGSSAIGNFANENCSAIGVKFHKANGDAHYAYLLVDTDIESNPPKLTLKAYAWEQTANTPITIADLAAPVKNVAANVTGNSGNVSDVQYSFDADCGDASFTEHRVIIVKDAAAASFDATAAASVGAASYTAVTPNGGPYSGNFAANALDADGDAITVGDGYQVFVYSTGTTNELSTGGSFVIPIAFTQNTTGLVLTDIADFADGRDLNLAFNKAADETNVDSYTAIILKANQADTASLSFLSTIPVAAHNNLAVTGSNLNLTLNSGSVDADGDAITYGVAYKALVVTSGNAATGNAANLSVVSNPVTLNAAALTNGANNVVLSDIADNFDPRDLQVSFDKAADETNVSEYWVYILPSAVADTAGGSFLVSLGGNATNVYPNGSNQVVNYGVAGVDAFGDLIAVNEPYKAIVLTFGSAATGGLFIQSVTSNQTTLNGPSSPVLTSGATGLLAIDVADNFNATDLQLAFTKATDETNVDSYKIYVLPSSIADTASLALLNTVPSSNYLTNNPTGSNQTFTFPANQLDIFGSLISSTFAYKILIVTQGNATVGNSQLLSNPSNQITTNGFVFRSATSTANAIVLTQATSKVSANDLEVSFNKGDDENYIQEYSVIILPEALADAATISYVAGLNSANFIDINPSGANQTVRTAQGAIDGAGDPLTAGTTYKALVLTMGTSTAGDTAILSTASNAITLSSDTASGIKAVDDIAGVELYSFADVINLNVTNEAVIGESIIVTNVAGQQVYSGLVKAGNQTINLAPVSAGMYIAIIQHNGAILRKKVFIGK